MKKKKKISDSSPTNAAAEIYSKRVSTLLGEMLIGPLLFSQPLVMTSFVVDSVNTHNASNSVCRWCTF